jgi:hypothetical protein
LWVDPICSSSSDPATCSTLGTYTPGTSTTSHNLGTPFGITYGLGSVSGTYYTDQVAVGSASLPSLQFGVATTSSYVSFGILGLAPILDPLPYQPFIFKLASQGIIGSPAFSLDLRSISDPTG